MRYNLKEVLQARVHSRVGGNTERDKEIKARDKRIEVAPLPTNATSNPTQRFPTDKSIISAWDSSFKQNLEEVSIKRIRQNVTGACRKKMLAFSGELM